jgi:hypothetical protein
MTDQHSAAPWALVFVRDPDTRQLTSADVRTADGKIVHMVGGLARCTPDERRRWLADARLIAQAPALLELARAWLTVHQENGRLPPAVGRARALARQVLLDLAGPDAQAEEAQAIDQLAAACPRCKAPAGERCRNYKGQAKQTCPGRGQAHAQADEPQAAQAQGGLFDYMQEGE